MRIVTTNAPHSFQFHCDKRIFHGLLWSMEEQSGEYLWSEAEPCQCLRTEVTLEGTSMCITFWQLRSCLFFWPMLPLGTTPASSNLLQPQTMLILPGNSTRLTLVCAATWSHVDVHGLWYRRGLVNVPGLYCYHYLLYSINSPKSTLSILPLNSCLLYIFWITQLVLFVPTV